MAIDYTQSLWLESKFDRNVNKDRKKRLRTAFFWTFGYICLVLFFVLVIKIHHPKPLADEEGQGLLVDFGYSDVGLGENQLNENDQVNIPAPGSPPFEQTIKEELLVQDDDENVPIESNQGKMAKDQDIKTNRIVKVENLIKKKAVTEKIAHKDNALKEASKEQVSTINENAIFKKSNKTSASNSQGNTSGTGNMGDPSGSQSNLYFGKSTGQGSAGAGRGMVGSGLNSRKVIQLPTVLDNSNLEGRIVISVKVNAQGKVVSAKYQAKGSTLFDSDLIAQCEQKAKTAVFSAAEDTPEDYGTIYYNFKVR
ncbi:MAG: hypothetical protein MUE53_09180 [Chitinophagales bacterium]|jgi:outer membrane biosynthesis protein TonB|nr:hypothetical protein [Chitinophagales bacterium]